MKCEQIGRKLQSYVDGELTDPQLLERFEIHLTRCESCHRSVLARRKLVGMLKAMFGLQREDSTVMTPL